MYTLEQLSKGEVACTNDGTLEQLKAVLKHCFPKYEQSLKGYGDFYAMSKTIKTDWEADYSTNLPTQSVVEFYKQLQFQHNTMNKQYLTRKQLIELHKADSCTEWKDNIENILNSRLTPFSLDSDKINIDNFYINLVNSRCNAHQKQLLQNLGIKLSNEIAVCDSKDGDCIRISSTYYINRGGFVSIFQYNALQELQFRSTDYVKVFSPDIVGELITKPLSLQIKLN